MFFGQCNFQENHSFRSPQGRAKYLDIPVLRSTVRLRLIQQLEKGNYKGNQNRIQIMLTHKNQGNDRQDGCLRDCVKSNQQRVQRVSHCFRKTHHHTQGDPRPKLQASAPHRCAIMYPSHSLETNNETSKKQAKDQRTRPFYNLANH